MRIADYDGQPRGLAHYGSDGVPEGIAGGIEDMLITETSDALHISSNT